MKLLLRWVFVAAVLAGIILGLLLARPAIAQAPQSNSSITNPPYGPIQSTIVDNQKEKLSPEVLFKSKTSTAIGTGAYSGRHYSTEEVIQLIKDYSSQYGISPDLPLAVARCESGYNQYSKNKSSTASGVFQYLQSTWRHTESGLLGISVFDADANVHMAVKSIASGGISNWAASKACWSAL